MHQVDAARNSSGVCRELAEGIGSWLGWRKGVHQKKTETHWKIIGGLTMTGEMKLQPNDGPRLSLSIGPGFGRCSGISPEFTRRFTEGIGKLARNMLGDCRKKTIGLTARIPEAARLTGGLVFTQRRSVMDACVPQEGGLGKQEEDKHEEEVTEENPQSTDCMVHDLASYANP
ncbi:hypothetical protein GW17_00042460 [Ensete ventricosum]|nr:hypothetical protein GW17_00042460 [Ensete ventricosum]